MIISKFKSKQLLIATAVIAIILLGVHLYAFSVLYPQFKAQFSQFILNCWLLATCMVIAVYSGAWMQKLHAQVKKYFYKLLYILFYRNTRPCLLLDKNLSIVCLNQAAQKSFWMYDKKISKQHSDFSIVKLLASNMNFAELCPNTKIKQILASMTHSIYTNKFDYGTLKLMFKIKKIEVLGQCLGFVTALKFDNTQKPADDYQDDRLLLENLRLKMLNLMLEGNATKSHSEYLNLYNNINSIINIKKSPAKEVSRNSL